MLVKDNIDTQDLPTTAGSLALASAPPPVWAEPVRGRLQLWHRRRSGVGIKPTVGTVPTSGVVPISSSPDSPGPMAMTMRDAASLLTVLAADGHDYAAHAVPGRLAGKRIGVPRTTYWGYSPHADAAAERALSLLAAEGATIVDHTDLPAYGDEVGEDELLVLLADFRAGVEDYLAARERGLAATRSGGIDHVLREHGLDALVTPSYPPAHPIDFLNAETLAGSCTSPTAIAGYPLVTVPTELAAGLPVAVSFWGTAGSEGTLIGIAHGYEVARDRSSGQLVPPTFPTFVLRVSAFGGWLGGRCAQSAQNDVATCWFKPSIAHQHRDSL